MGGALAVGYRWVFLPLNQDILGFPTLPLNQGGGEGGPHIGPCAVPWPLR